MYSLIYNNNVDNTDAIKFRNEYMELNDKLDDNSNQTYLNISISEKNTVKYLTEEEAVNLITKGTGIIYFGYPSCFLCRSLVPTLTDVALNYKETIYYVNIEDIRAEFAIEDGKLNKIKDGSKGYYEIITALDEVLNDFNLDDGNSKIFETGEKIILAPMIVAFKDGMITYYHIGTISSQLSSLEGLTKEQKTELENLIKKIINSKN